MVLNKELSLFELFSIDSFQLKQFLQQNNFHRNHLFSSKHFYVFEGESALKLKSWLLFFYKKLKFSVISSIGFSCLFVLFLVQFSGGPFPPLVGKKYFDLK